MNIENQCISLEIAKRLKELGVKQDSLFYYLNIDGEGIYYIYYDDYLPEDYEYEGDPISAFTASELLELLPKYIKQGNFEFYYTQMPSKHLDEWIIFYRNSFVSWNNFDGEDQSDKSIANCMGKMLIYLIEKGLIKNED